MLRQDMSSVLGRPKCSFHARPHRIVRSTGNRFDLIHSRHTRSLTLHHSPLRPHHTWPSSLSTPRRLAIIQPQLQIQVRTRLLSHLPSELPQRHHARPYTNSTRGCRNHPAQHIDRVIGEIVAVGIVIAIRCSVWIPVPTWQ